MYNNSILNSLNISNNWNKKENLNRVLEEISKEWPDWKKEACSELVQQAVYMYEKRENLV